MHWLVISARALQLALQSASTDGGRTEPSHFGAFQVPSQRAWQVPLQLPLHSPLHEPTQFPWASLAEHSPAH